MKKLNVFLAIVLVVSMLMPMTVSARIVMNDDVCVENAHPDIDGVISASEGWSDPIHMNKDTLSAVVNVTNELNMSAEAYMAYSESGLYVAAEITDSTPCVSNLNYLAGGDYGFDGDVFVFTLDPLMKMSEDTSRYDTKAPMYCVSYDENGNAAIYHSQCGENDGIVNDPNAKVDVKITETGWNFEMFIPWDVIVNDVYANSNGEIYLDSDDKIDLIYRSKDNKATFIYVSRIFDQEAEEDVTYAVFATCAESTLDGYPGAMCNGVDVKTFGITFYLNHEHDYLYYTVETPAGFKSDGLAHVYCGVCEEFVTDVVIPRVPFTDVFDGQWYSKALLECYNHGYLNGTSDTTFSPNVSMTRGMFVQILSNYFGADTAIYETNVFDDVKPGKWYYHAVAWAYENNITSGTSSNTFSPDKPITREEAASLFMRAAQACSAYEAPAMTDFSGYSDANQVSSWAKDAMLWAVENGIITGTTNTTLSPKTTASRIVVAKMLINFDAAMEEYYNKR